MINGIKIFSLICLLYRKITSLLRISIRKLTSINAISKHLALSANSSPIDIRVMTYNLHHGLNMKKVIDLTKIASIINKFKPDLVALQELDNKTNRTHGVEQLHELANMTQMYYVFSPAIDFEGGQYGVGILSKHQIHYNSTYPLPQVVVNENRTVGLIQTEISGQKIFFASTHLDVKSNTNRLLQVNKLFSILNDTDSEVPLIIGGDFNAKPNSAEIIKMKEKFTDISENLGFTIPSDVPDRKIDYLFISSKFRNNYKLIEGQVIPETIASDHRPVFAYIQFNK